MEARLKNQSIIGTIERLEPLMIGADEGGKPYVQWQTIQRFGCRDAKSLGFDERLRSQYNLKDLVGRAQRSCWQQALIVGWLMAYM